MTTEGKVQMTKHLIDNKTKENFKNALQEMTWDKVISSKQIDSPCEVFLNIFTSFYEKIIEKFVVKSKTLKNLWTTKDILKSPKTKQKLYDKFSNSKICELDISCKNYG